MRASLPSGVMAALIVSIASAAQAASLEELQSRCAQKTVVYGTNGERVGETLDAYCTGFLEGAFALMVSAQMICPEKTVNAGFLLSLVNTYAADRQLKGVDAGPVMEAAYERAFLCKNK